MNQHDRCKPGESHRGVFHDVTRSLGVKIRLRRAPALFLAALLVAAPVVAQEDVRQGVFALGMLDEVATGDTLVYAHQRSGSATSAEGLPAIAEGSIEITLEAADDGTRKALVSLDEGERKRELSPFPGAAGNPVLMILLETNTQNMATATGGSPFYIRNRIREALVATGEGAPVTLADGEAEGRHFNVRPFADDANRDRMGLYAGLEIDVILSDAVPGGVASIEAAIDPGPDGAPALHETLSFDRIEETAQ